ncbi:hypothetical protein HZC07_04930 [Candidatus Micrarchaeota archaeon]|nr:hypothetical protein [Candidatus Micrarchaeota archaeon]
MTLELTKILGGLVFYPENIKRNLELSNGLIMAERIMIYLTDAKGMGRQEAHELVRTLSHEAFNNQRHLRDVILEKKVLTSDEAKKLFDYSTYIGSAEKIVENAVRE